MNIDYEKLGRIIEKVEDASPCSNMTWKEMTEAARQVIASSGLLEEVERLKKQEETVVKNAIDLISCACEKHEEFIRNQPFAEFKKDEDSIGCKRCLKEEVERLRAKVDEFNEDKATRKVWDEACENPYASMPCIEGFIEYDCVGWLKVEPKSWRSLRLPADTIYRRAKGDE